MSHRMVWQTTSKLNFSSVQLKIFIFSVTLRFLYSPLHAEKLDWLIMLNKSTKEDLILT